MLEVLVLRPEKSCKEIRTDSLVPLISFKDKGDKSKCFSQRLNRGAAALDSSFKL